MAGARAKSDEGIFTPKQNQQKHPKRNTFPNKTKQIKQKKPRHHVCWGLAFQAIHSYAAALLDLKELRRQGVWKEAKGVFQKS